MLLSNFQDRLQRIFQDVFNDEALLLSDRMTSADISGWDSLGHINLMFAIESAFGIQFTGNELADMKNVGELRALIQRKAHA
jgi:acyl carrier protein